MGKPNSNAVVLFLEWVERVGDDIDGFFRSPDVSAQSLDCEIGRARPLPSRQPLQKRTARQEPRPPEN